MKASQIVIGKVYIVKVSGDLVRVRITSSRFIASWNGQTKASGWLGTNLATGREIKIKSAQRIRYEVK